MIRNEGDAKGAYNLAKQEAGDLISWFNEIESGTLPIVDKSIGNLKISFMYSFHFLISTHTDKELTYEKCIYEMLLKGGDTDTNAAIVGGLLGAYFGVRELP